MRVEMLNEDDLDIYINPYNFNDLKESNKESILECVKTNILKINRKYKLNLSGFYKIKAYFNKKAGLFLNVIKLDDNEFSNEADFRIVLYQNEDYLLEIDDYDLIRNLPKKMYYNGKFYININDINNINKLIDMGKIIYGDEAKYIIKNSKIIK